MTYDLPHGAPYDRDAAMRDIHADVPHTRTGEFLSLQQVSDLRLSDCYTTTIAYVVIPWRARESVLEHGFQTRRKKIYCSFMADPYVAVEQFRGAKARETDVCVLRVIQIPDGVKLNYRRKCICTNFLPAECFAPSWFADLEGYRKRAADYDSCGEDDAYDEIPCHYCGQRVYEHAEDRTATSISFRCWGVNGEPSLNCRVTNPCTNKNCKRKMMTRTKRFRNMQPELLYHMTKTEGAAFIRDSGLSRGTPGTAGSGLYFAFSPKETEWKAEVKRGEEKTVLECLVWRGRTFDAQSNTRRNATFSTLAQNGYDSVTLRRGAVPDGPKEGEPSGDEVVVYSWDQCIVIREVARDLVDGTN